MSFILLVTVDKGVMMTTMLVGGGGGRNGGDNPNQYVWD